MTIEAPASGTCVLTWGFALRERVTGIEPAPPAREASVSTWCRHVTCG